MLFSSIAGRVHWAASEHQTTFFRSRELCGVLWDVHAAIAKPEISTKNCKRDRHSADTNGFHKVYTPLGMVSNPGLLAANGSRTLVFCASMLCLLSANNDHVTEGAIGEFLFCHETSLLLFAGSELSMMLLGLCSAYTSCNRVLAWMQRKCTASSQVCSIFLRTEMQPH